MNTNLKLAMAALVGACVILAPSRAFAGSVSGFGDVADDAYFTTPVAWLTETDITTGLEPGCFGPSDDVTRGQAAVFLFRLDKTLGNSPVAGPNPFDDVTAVYQLDAVGWMAASRITTGVTPTTFEPEAPITRGDFATLLWRYAGRPTNHPRHSFLDVTADYQQDAISWMAARRITTGITATAFAPDGLVTRAQAATFLFRYAAPSSVGSPAGAAECNRGMRNALISAGFSIAEATCAAPYLADFSVDFLNRVVSEETPTTAALLDTLVTIQSSGCLSLERTAELIQAHF